jgi:Ca2+:H+ antiporter
VAAILLVTYALGQVFILLTDRQTGAELTGGHAEPVRGQGQSGWAVVILAVTTCLIAFLSELLIGAIEVAQTNGYLARWRMSEIFIGVIVVALVGNVAEHAAAVTMAYRNKVDVTLHIAIGSSMQIALLIAPSLVFISLGLGPRLLDLVFTPLEVLALIACVVVLALVANDGESHWMEGVLLLAVYLILALAFYHLPQAAEGNVKIDFPKGKATLLPCFSGPLLDHDPV